MYKFHQVNTFQKAQRVGGAHTLRVIYTLPWSLLEEALQAGLLVQ